MSDMPEVIYAHPSVPLDYTWGAWLTVDECCTKYISAEKAKADKLALMEEVAHLINSDFCDREDFRIIWQRIEAE